MLSQTSALTQIPGNGMIPMELVTKLVRDTTKETIEEQRDSSFLDHRKALERKMERLWEMGNEKLLA